MLATMQVKHTFSMKHRRIAYATFCAPLMFLAISSQSAHAQEHNEFAKLIASDAAANDWFGYSVATSGDTVVVGAFQRDCAAGSNCGAAYVFLLTFGEWTQLAKLTASDAVANDSLGRSVSISGDTIVVGANQKNSGRGAAYVFVKPGGGWSNMTQTAKLTASDAATGDQLGWSISNSGDTVVVGAYLKNAETGAAYVFVKTGGGWSDMTQTAKMAASDAAFNDDFGFSVSISGDAIVANGKGVAYVFNKPGGGWINMTQTAKLTAPDGIGSVSISGDTVVTNGNESAYVFVKPGGGWSNMSPTAKLTASDGVGGDEFGHPVSISGDMIAVGAWQDNCAGGTFCGSAYAFEKPGSGWSNMTQTTKLTSSDGNGGDQLGASISIAGNTVVVGAYYKECGGGGGFDCGAAYVFPAKLIHYVKPSGTDFASGLSWETANETIRAALDARLSLS